MFQRSFALAMIACAGLSACGGGGGGSGAPSQPQATLSVGPTSIAVSAAQNGTAPSASLIASIQVDTTTPGQYTYYGKGTSTHVGIASITQVSGGDGTYTILFDTPSTLAVGTYQDTITIEGCYDSACTQQILGSPQTVAVTYTVIPAPPTLSSLSPAIAAANTAFTLTINGSGFTSASVIIFDGAALPTTFISATQVQASISATAVQNPGPYNVSVASTAAEGAPVSNVLVETSVYLGAITGITPATAVAGGAQFTLTVSGGTFSSTAVVVFGSTDLPTTLVNPQQLTATVSASLLQTASTVPVTVRASSDPAAPVTNAVSFTIQPLPALGLNSVYPGTVTVGGTGPQLTLLGQGFLPTAVAFWNGVALPTTYVSQAELQAQVPTADIAAAGTANVTVKNTSGGATPPLPVLISAPASDAVAIQMNPAHTGAVTFNGMSLPTASTWTTTLGGPVSYALIAEGKIVVTYQPMGGTSQLIALDQKTGATVWGPVTLPGLASPVYDAGKVFVLSNPLLPAPNTTLQSYDFKSGHLDWSTSIAGSTSGALFLPVPTALNGLLYAYGIGTSTGNGNGSNQFFGNLYAFTEATGAITWTQTMPSGSTGTVAATNAGVYTSLECSANGFLPTTGASLFAETNCQGGAGFGGIPVVANNVLYAPNGQLGPPYQGQTLNATTGAALGTYTDFNAPAIGTQTAFEAIGGGLNAVDLNTNTVLWTFNVTDNLNTSPILVNQTVFIGSQSGNLYALNALTGAQLSMTNVGSTINGSPSLGTQSNVSYSGLAAGDGVLIVPVGSSVVCFTLSTNP